MGGACMAIVDDGMAAYYNPAGLGQIRRIEFGATFDRNSLDVKSEWLGYQNQASVSATRLENMAISYPFPTYRGSLVFTGSMFRVTSFDQYLDRRAVKDMVEYHDTEEREAVLTAWSGAMATQISPDLFIGAEAHVFTGKRNYEDHYYPWYPCPPPGGVFSETTDLGGYGGAIGLIYIPHPLISLGVVAKTPQRISIEGSEVYTRDDTTGCYMDHYRIDENIDIPYSIGFGVGLRPPSLDLDLDFVFTDWHELDYPGRVRDPETGNFLFDATTDIRVGAEYSLPVAPVRIRAGYAYVPLALNKFDIEKDRQRISFGAGTIVESTLTVDAAWQHTNFKRSDPEASYSENRTTDRLILSFAYRF